MSARVPVLIVGGGPVGLLLAAELGWRGIECLLVECDAPEERAKKLPEYITHENDITIALEAQRP